MVISWVVDPTNIGNRFGMAALLAVVFASAVVVYALRNHPLRFTGDVAILGSLVLIDVAVFFTKLHSHPGLLSPFFVWVGFASPLWFPRRRAALYAFLAMVASGIVIVVAGTAEAVAGWVITIATLIVAFCITSFLTDMLIKREKLAVVGEMASVVGHDLRNPLGVVSNSLFLLRHGLGSEVTEDQDRHFRTAEREIEKASEIIDDLRTYVRTEVPVAAPFELAPLVSEVLEVAAAPPGINVTVDIPPIVLRADRGQLAQVLTNLVTNAYEAMEERGTLRVTASIDGRLAVIEVHDTGPGIEPRSTERVFEPFYTTKQWGTGLGLAIVRRLVESNGGSVRIRSDDTGGTRFLVTLPAHRRPGTGGRAAGAVLEGPDPHVPVRK